MDEDTELLGKWGAAERVDAGEGKEGREERHGKETSPRRVAILVWEQEYGAVSWKQRGSQGPIGDGARPQSGEMADEVPRP